MLWLIHNTVRQHITASTPVCTTVQQFIQQLHVQLFFFRGLWWWLIQKTMGQPRAKVSYTDSTSSTFSTPSTLHNTVPPVHPVHPLHYTMCTHDHNNSYVPV